MATTHMDESIAPVAPEHSIWTKILPQVRRASDAQPGVGALDKVAYERLRELRVVIQDLQTILDSIRKGEAALATYAPYIATVTTRDIPALMQALAKESTQQDAIRHILDVWEQMQVCPLLTDPTTIPPAQDQLHHLNMLDAQCRAIVYQVGYLTIPDKINEWLNRAGPGYYLPFHIAFAAELPVFEDRVQLLNYLAWSPKLIRGGLVGSSSGLIYRYSRVWWRLWLSLLVVLLAIGLATLIVVATSGLSIDVNRLFGTQPFIKLIRLNPHAVTLLWGWVLLLAGIVVHIAVGTAKRMQTQPGLPPVLPLQVFLPLINARAGQIVLKLVLALFGFFGLTAAVGIAAATPLNFFLAGYSLDSVVELFSANIEQRAAAQLSHLREQNAI